MKVLLATTQTLPKLNSILLIPSEEIVKFLENKI